MNPETKRGLKEGHLHFETLRTRWPRAFPARRHEVRPLASSVAPMVAAELQWSEPFARGVLKRWKSGEWYCRACLVHLTRIAIDGSSTEETVDDEARASARQQIERLEAKRNALGVPNGTRNAGTGSDPDDGAVPKGTTDALDALAGDDAVRAEPPAAQETAAKGAEAVAPPIERKRDGFAALRQAHRNRTAVASPSRW